MKKEVKKKRERWECLPDRRIDCGKSDITFPNNQISTSKYSVITFLPKNLIEQFTKAANVYFLVLSVMQTIKPISISGGIPTILTPLAVIVAISALKSLFEDYKRHKSDNAENNSICKKLENGNYVPVKWKDIRVGDIIMVEKGEFIPCDFLLLRSSDPKGVCFIETKGLDGETNLKTRFVHEDIKKLISSESLASQVLGASFYFEKPNPFLGKFKGSLTIGQATLSLNENNFLLRGCSLQNTEKIIGVVGYTG